MENVYFSKISTQNTVIYAENNNFNNQISFNNVIIEGINAGHIVTNLQ